MRLQLPHRLPPWGSISAVVGSSSVGGRLGKDDEFAKQDNRVPPWSNQEIRDLIAIRGELQIEFSSTSRSNLKNLWEIVGVRMSERGYRRSGEQCKSKWKTLVTRYKDMPPESSSASGRSSSVGDRLGRDDEFATRDGRVPPWSNQEIRDFIAIRGELQIEFSSTKRSNLKNLWEIVGVWMNERGYRRSGEQCKIKWKNLITRYKSQCDRIFQDNALDDVKKTTYDVAQFEGYALNWWESAKRIHGVLHAGHYPSWQAMKAIMASNEGHHED
ncbi:Trihelix transcription factor GT-3a [Capsicum annuum]|uniref:Trihelix transcription factor GT-3a n=1 Tax=Capsicum annuum TaxID=4072 RepID=A0A2G3ANW3_CAPAN|nr:Trihelix transcription factor GT-3a [Capsicum annuum]